MKQKMDEQKYSHLFKKLKQKDEELAPSFERVWQAALSKTERTERTWSFHRFAIAAVLMIALVGSLLFYNKQGLAPVQTMTEWQSPTNSLLIFPGDELAKFEISAVTPEIANSLFRWESPTSSLIKFSNR